MQTSRIFYDMMLEMGIYLQCNILNLFRALTISLRIVKVARKSYFIQQALMRSVFHIESSQEDIRRRSMQGIS